MHRAGAPKESQEHMPSTKSKLRLICAFAALAALALAVSCRGFFVSPTLTALAIGPANLTLAPSTSYQMVATGTYSDGSTRTVTGQAVWTSTNTGAAAFSTTTIGLLIAAPLANLPTLPGTTTVSASDGTVSSSTQTVNVCPVVQTLTITVNNGTSWSGTGGTILMFDAKAAFEGAGTSDVTSTVTWTISNTSVLPTIDTTGSGTTNTNEANMPTTVYGTLCGTTSNTVTITTTS